MKLNHMTKTNQNKQALVPELRFPEFEGDGEWHIFNGNKLFKQINDRDHNGDLPVLAITQEQGAIPRDLIDYNVSVTQSSIDSYKIVRVGDFIISLRSFQGGIEYSDYEGICSPAYVVLREKGDTVAALFKHFFKSKMFIRELTKNLEGLRDGKMISYKQFSEVLINLPSKAEQQKIADCLASLDDLIAAHSRRLAALQEHKKGLLQQLFPAEGETTPKLRFPGFEHSNGWKRTKLENLAKRGSGHTPSKSHPEYYNGGIKWVSLADSKRLDLGLISETRIQISKLGIKNSSATLHPKGSVILSRDAGVGMSAILAEPMAVSQHFMAWNPNKDKLSNWYLYFFLQCAKPQFERVATGSTIKTIGLQFFKDFDVVAPSLGEQNRIADCFYNLDNLIAVQTQEIGLLEDHKKGLMQRLFPKPELELK